MPVRHDDQLAVVGAAGAADAVGAVDQATVEALYVDPDGGCNPRELVMTGASGPPAGWRVTVDRRVFRPAVYDVHPELVWVVFRPTGAQPGTTVKVDQLTLIACDAAVVMCARADGPVDRGAATVWRAGPLTPQPIATPDLPIGPVPAERCRPVPAGWGPGGGPRAARAGTYADSDDYDSSTDDDYEDATVEDTLEADEDDEADDDEPDDEDDEGRDPDAPEDETEDLVDDGCDDTTAGGDFAAASSDEEI